jgi:uncharacterized damage-inducible protein DinB
MTELEQAILGDSAAAPATHILEGLTDDLLHRKLPNVPHTIYEELWHLVFWQQITLDWISDVETPYPTKASDGFPSNTTETFDQLRNRFFRNGELACSVARDTTRLDRPVRCSSSPGNPIRIMSVHDQLISLATHNAYHLGRIVLLRQLLQAWPPSSGGSTW